MGQRVKAMTAKCAWDEEKEQKRIVEVMMQATNYYEVRVMLYALETQELILTE